MEEKEEDLDEKMVTKEITGTIQRSDTILRNVIAARIKLQITLSFLATGNSFLFSTIPFPSV